MPSIEPDEASASGLTEPIQLSIDGRSMRLHDIECAIELMITDAKLSDKTLRNSDKKNKGNSLDLINLGNDTKITEDLIKLITQTKDWDSISLTNFMGDRTLCNDLLLACTTHPSVRSLSWRARIADAINAGTTRILIPTDFSTVHALLYGIKYGSQLTKLEATGLVLDANMANLLSRALVRNTTLLELILNGTRFLSEESSNENRRSNENHRGTKNATVQTLSFGLRFNRTIESLSLDMCNDLEDEDIACLINAVNSDGTVLRRLSLQETACFDQGMSSVAVLLQENVIEDINLNYLVRRRRKRPPEKEEETKNRDQEDNEEEDQATKEEDSNSESVETKSDEKEKEEGEAIQDSDAGVQEDKEKQDEAPTEDSNQNEPTNDVEKLEEPQQVRNTSLKVLSMAGNFLDDDYLESLLNIFPPLTYQSTSSKEESPCSRLEELTLLGNRFSNHGIKELLKKLPRFPYLQRLYLGYQRAPPPQGPIGLPPAILSKMMVSNPSLSDKNTQFDPGSLRKELVTAVSENPRNFRLTDVSMMALTNEDKNTDKIVRYHMRLNIGGRKLLASYVKSNSTAAAAENKTQSLVPLGLWPLVLDRANRLYPLPALSGGNENNTNCGDGQSVVPVETGSLKELISDCDRFHAGDVIFWLGVHGPMIFENLDRRPVQD